MSTELTQENRHIAINTPLGKDKLLLKSISMTDEIGRPFVCQCELRTTEHLITAKSIIGQPAAIRINLGDGKFRYIHGVISRFASEGTPRQGRLNKFVATVVPALWFLSRTSDCRAFVDHSVPEVMKKIFEQHGKIKVEMRTKATYKKRDLIVQYRETALNFISRLIEEEGIYYYVEHAEDSHTVVFCDDHASLPEKTPAGDVEFREQEDGSGGEHLWELTRVHTLMPGKFMLRDYDFQNPGKLLDSDSVTAAQKHNFKEFEAYDFPGFYGEKADGDRYVKVRREEADAQHDLLVGDGDVRSITVGHKFNLKLYPIDELNAKLLMTSAHFTASTDEFGSASAQAAGGQGEAFRVNFTAMLASTPFRSARSTPKPNISGPQTAFVTGPAGDEIYTDEFGRVMVQFLWDREGKSDEKSSCWIRVSQGWAGKKYGMFFLPRIGHEVIVEFLEGDPDRPLITGRVYNAGTQGQVPYKLPDNKTQSTIKTCSSTGGKGFNEIRFEDKKDSEHLFIHAEKDYHDRVKNDRLEIIGHDRDLIVVNDQREHIKNDRSETIDRDHKEHIKRDRNVKIDGKEAVEIVGSKSLKVTSDVIEVFEANQSTKITKDLYIKAKNICIEADTNITLKVGGTHIAIEGDSILIEATGKIEVKSGGTTSIDAGDKIKGKAKSDITFKASGGDFKAEGGKNAEIKGAVGAKLEGGATADVKAATTNVKGDAMATVKAAIVMIN